LYIARPGVACTSNQFVSELTILSDEGKAQPDPPSIEPVEKKNDKKPAKRNPRLKLTEQLVNGR
jgi:hypothetical protein